MKNFKNLCMLVIAFMLFSVGTSNAQSMKNRAADEPMSKNAVYGELLGNGLIFSFNYDRRLINNVGARVGLGFVGSASDGGVVTVPVMGNILLGKNGRYFEIGAGITYLSGTGDFFDLEDEPSSVLGTFSLMYRRQPADGGFMWKIGLTPMLAKGFFFPYWGGLSLGYCW
ncbi:MAG: hypothetical protein J5I52_10830 [Saprospiraceae bacterium]|nr:hypothetical protein [Saprospiraceae bacterium]